MDAESMAPTSWPAYVAGALGVIGYVGIWWQNFQRRQHDATLKNQVETNTTEIKAVDQQRTIDKVQITGALDAVEKTQERLIRLLQDENKELRDRYEAAVDRHNRETIELRAEIAVLRDAVGKVTQENERRQADYDKSRVEIHTLRNELNAVKLENALLKSEKAGVEKELAAVKAKPVA